MAPFVPFPDQSHINHVRDALWKRSLKASVMVGAGFSRNAERVPPGERSMPTWIEIAKEMFQKMYLSGKGGYPHPLDAMPSETSGFLRLAQEYEATFGRSELHKFVMQQLQDEAFKPGETHLRLLRLPWRDVFTTNWDTLLERAYPFVTEHPYSVVRAIDEIPLAEGRRIIKLHGSVSAHFPLIFTEEDYRTYPVKFSPFVNTVQQAMMETVFCLIGFSGDDPNFLHWSGWVRDNLRDSAPKIYLAGWLGLSPHRRRMLEDRNVVPIDLALHPKSRNWPEHLRSDYAIQWILHTLECGRPYDIVRWPHPPEHGDSRFASCLEPIVKVVSEEPKLEPDAPTQPNMLEDTQQDLQASVTGLLSVWAHNRKLYPGWLSIPPDRLITLSLKTQDWESLILKVLPGLEPIGQLNAIYEWVWRKETLLEPMTSEFEVAAVEVLEKFDFHNRSIEGSERPEIDWDTTREAWRTIGLTLVTSARQDFDRKLFEQRIQVLQDFQNDYPDVKHRIHHERCLWAVYSLDYETLEKLLNDWELDVCDPVWMMRKSALLCEFGNYEDARHLVKTAIEITRKNFIDSNSVAWASREGWALCLANACDWCHSILNPNPEDHFDMSGNFGRWDELAVLKCNALSQKNYYAEAMRNQNDNKSEPWAFDLGGGRNRNIRFSGNYSCLSAYRAVRLSEVAGLPPSARNIVVASDILRLSADLLSTHDPALAVRLILRSVNNDKDKMLNTILSRTRVAGMDKDSVVQLARICIRMVEFTLPRLAVTQGSNQYGFWVERLRVAMESLSRFIVRVDSEMCDSVFCKALHWYKNPNVVRHSLLKDPIEDVLRRSWESLPGEKKSERALDILSAPIIGMDDFKTDVEGYPEPGYLLSRHHPSHSRTASHDKRWKEVVEYIVRGLREGGEARKRASARLSWLAMWDFLTGEEKSDVAGALWESDYSGHDHLPIGTGLLDWAFFILPEPEPGLAEQRFRGKWLKTESELDDIPSADDICWHVGSAIDNLKIYEKLFVLSDLEQEYLARVVGLWAESPISQQIRIVQADSMMSMLQNPEVEQVQRTIQWLQPILLEVSIPRTIAEKLYGKIQDLRECQLQSFNLMAGLVKALPERLDEVVSTMKTGLSSDESQEATSALQGLWVWLENSTVPDAKISPPPDDLIREVGVIIATRRKVSLSTALQFARRIFSRGSQKHRDNLSDLALQGLGYLLAELQYDRNHDEDVDVPLLRWRCARLAFAMAECGFRADSTIISWIESARNDPLPEVRHAKCPAIFRQDGETSDE